MTPAEDRCPVHSKPGADVLNAWPCPDDCQEFLAELERQLDDVRIHGNFVRMHTDDDGVRWRQSFRNHQPVGEPEPWMSRGQKPAV